MESLATIAGSRKDSLLHNAAVVPPPRKRARIGDVDPPATSSSRKRSWTALEDVEKEWAMVLRCGDCRFWTKSPETYHLHRLTNHSSIRKPFKCSSCGLAAKRLCTIVAHILEQNDDGHHNSSTLHETPMPEDKYQNSFQISFVRKGLSEGFYD